MTMRRGGSVQNRRRERERKRRQQRQESQPQRASQQPQRPSQQPQQPEEAEEAVAIPSERVPVDSRAIRWWQYNQESQTFSVEYVTGGVYAYRGVPPRLIDDALYGFPTLKSPKGLDFGWSWGRFMNQHIKGNYPYQKIYQGAR